MFYFASSCYYFFKSSKVVDKFMVFAGKFTNKSDTYITSCFVLVAAILIFKEVA
ncbi:hypothetical protein [Anaerococcus tetradius]|uniref:hypothetical protein n=1 Tax=Anaerococcus tetradius TaxID=33036 RepID=UPI0023EFCAF5|nr:hypothetical protein [Anaerococcus tetradius]